MIHLNMEDWVKLSEEVLFQDEEEEDFRKRE